jgi:regulator of protease activity HflC (stomatin/prohibitin superfamily)
MEQNKKKLGTMGAMSAAAILTVGAIAGCHTTRSDEVSFKNSFGEIKENYRGAGINWDLGRNDVDVKITNKNLKVTCPSFSKDLQTVSPDIMITYCIPKDKARALIAEYGMKSDNNGSSMGSTIGNFERVEERLAAKIGEISELEIGKFKGEDIIPNRTTLRKNVQDAVTKFVDEANLPIKLVDVAIGNIDFSKEFEKSVEQKMMAEQELARVKTVKATMAIEGRASGDKALQFVKAMGHKTVAQEIIGADGKTVDTYEVLDTRGYTPAGLSEVRAHMVNFNKFDVWKPTAVNGVSRDEAGR